MSLKGSQRTEGNCGDDQIGTQPHSKVVKDANMSARCGRYSLNSVSLNTCWFQKITTHYPASYFFPTRRIPEFFQRTAYCVGAGEPRPDNVALGHTEAFKEKYHQALNALPIDDRTVEKIVAEAKNAFRFNMQMAAATDVVADVADA